MELKSEITARILRLVAIVALLLGLADAARLLGVSSGPQSPIALLGPSGFAYLAAFCLARLFSAVGLWIKASWGAVLLVLATLVELALAMFDSPDVSLDIFGFAIRVIMVLTLAGLFGLRLRLRQVHD